MFKKTYNNNLSIWIDGYEKPVRLPDKPPLSEYRNYGRPIHEQKFEREVIPAGLDRISKADRDRFVAYMWHKRVHGDWWLIKDQEIYIPGYAWFFLNSWETEGGGLPEFRMEAVEYFLVAENEIDNNQSYGLLIVKCRRLGDTEKTLCLGYDICTRFRHSDFGMQNTIETEAQANFERVVVSHNAMPFWFKPKHKGSDDLKTEIRLTYGEKNESERSGFDYNKGGAIPLMSSVTYRSTVFKAYDGRRLRFFHLDEYGKISKKVMDVVKQWGVVKQCLTLNNGIRIIGKALFTTTVEEIKNGDTIDTVQTLWDTSNPNDLQPNGRTTSGLVRYYRNYLKAAAVDEWGFHLVEEAKIARDMQIQAYERAKQLTELSNYKRKVPDLLDDALSIPATECVMYPELLDTQSGKIRQWERGDRVSSFWGARNYDLDWEGIPMQSKITARENPNGRFTISMHPVHPNNVRHNGERFTPGNRGIYTGGIDGYDHKEGTSDGGIAIFMPFNEMYEDASTRWLDTPDGSLVPEDKGLMKTNRFVLTYRHRPLDPVDFAKDAIKAMWYYGSEALPERDKPSVIRTFEGYGLESFLSFKLSHLKIGAARELDRGQKATTQFIDVWQGLLQSHLYNYYETYTHQNQVMDFRRFTGENRTKCDLLVASGHAIALAHQVTTRQQRQKKSNSRWGALPI